MTDQHHLSQIPTQWSIVNGAADPDHPDRLAAQQRLLEVYGKSIQRYLLASLRDENAANEVYQNFALKLVRGDLSSASPDKGRFRSFVKTVIYRLMIDHHRAAKRNRADEPPLELEDDEGTDVPDRVDKEFQQHWREGLLNHAWEKLQIDQEKRGGIYFSLLRARADHPDASHEELAREVEARTGTQPNPGSLRVTLHRARQKFADHLVEAVASSLSDRAEAHLEDELIALNLQRYCKEALERRQESD